MDYELCGNVAFLECVSSQADILNIAMTTVGGFQIFAKHKNQGENARDCPPKMCLFIMSSSVACIP